jgi:hypothetical protein
LGDNDNKPLRYSLFPGTDRNYNNPLKVTWFVKRFKDVKSIVRAIAYRSFSLNNSPDKQDGTGESCKSVASGIVFGLSKRAIIQLR